MRQRVKASREVEMFDGEGRVELGEEWALGQYIILCTHMTMISPGSVHIPGTASRTELPLSGN